MSETYRWTVSTMHSPEFVEEILEQFRPFRIQVNFSNGFSTKNYGDSTLYATESPLAKLHYLKDAMGDVKDKVVIDIGCHLGYYGYYLLERGASHYVGLDIDKRTFECANVIKALSTSVAPKIDFQLFDVGSTSVQYLTRVDHKADILLNLACINNVENFITCIKNMAYMLRSGGSVFLEYLGVDTREAICKYEHGGYRGDQSLKWIFSDEFIRRVFASNGLAHRANLLEWRNPEVIGAGAVKVMSHFIKV